MLAEGSLQESTRIQELRKQALEDGEYLQLREIILQGFPDHKSLLPDSCKKYWQARHSLTVDEGLIVHGCHLLIPSAMQKEILKELHKAHQGIVRTKQRACLSIYWPGMNNDIENIVTSCTQCQDHLPSNNKEPLLPKPKPTQPFQETAADFCCHVGRQYLIWVDCYSDWPIIVSMGKDTTTNRLLAALREIFSQTAVPDILWTDRGPQFMAKRFQSFARQWGFVHCTSTPYYPQSNGKAEATVKSMKKIIRSARNGRYLEEDTLCRAIMQCHNTPSWKDGLSPAQKLFGQPLQDTLPAHRSSFAPEWQHQTEQAEQLAQTSQEAAVKYYNLSAHNLPDIKVGSHVAVQHPDKTMGHLWSHHIHWTTPAVLYLNKNTPGVKKGAAKN